MSFGHFIGIRDMAAVQRKMVEHPFSWRRRDMALTAAQRPPDTGVFESGR